MVTGKFTWRLHIQHGSLAVESLIFESPCPKATNSMPALQDAKLLVVHLC